MKKSNEIVIKGEPQEVTEIRRQIISSFEDLVFYEENHKYFLHGKELPSVSAITHRFQEEFDSDGIAENYALKHGETKQYWLDQWKYNSLKATTTGTLVHEFAEGYFWLHNQHKELMPKSCNSKYDKYFKDIIPTRPKEEAVIKCFNDLPKEYWFVMNETKVYSGLNPISEMNTKEQYCGTFDLLMYYKHPTDDSKSGLIIMDWKTNASLQNDFSRSKEKMMYEPFSDLYAEALGNYYLQLNLYQIPLEDIGLKVIGRKILHLLDDGTYQKYDVPNLTQKLRNAL